MPANCVHFHRSNFKPLTNVRQQLSFRIIMHQLFFALETKTKFLITTKTKFHSGRKLLNWTRFSENDFIYSIEISAFSLKLEWNWDISPVIKCLGQRHNQFWHLHFNSTFKGAIATKAHQINYHKTNGH